jgi:hypothetical protein
MSKIIALIILLFFISTNSQAQLDVNVKLSKPYPVIDGEKHYFSHEDFFYTIKIVDRDIILHQFDPSLPKLIQKKTLSRAIKAGSIVESVLEFQGKVYIFFSRYRGANKKENLVAAHTLYYYIVDFESMKLQELKTLLAVPAKIKDRIQLKLSQDKSKLLAYCQLKKNIVKDNLASPQISMYVFSDKLEKLQGSNFVIPYDVSEINIADYLIANNGALSLILANKSNNNIEHLLLKPNSTTEFNKKEIALEKDKGPNFLSFQDQKANWNLIYSIQKGEKLIVKTLSDSLPLKEYTLPPHINKKYANKDNFKGYHLQEALPYKDGYLVLMQAYYYEKKEGYDYENLNSHTYDKDEKEAFKDRILIKFDKNFEQEWIQRIEQREDNKEYKFYLHDSQILLVCIKKETEKEVTLTNDMTLEDRTNATLILNNPIDLVLGFFFEQKTGQVKKVCFFKKNSIDKYTITQFNLKRFHPFDPSTFMAEFYKKSSQDIMIRAIIN